MYHTQLKCFHNKSMVILSIIFKTYITHVDARVKTYKKTYDALLLHGMFFSRSSVQLLLERNFHQKFNPFLLFMPESLRKGTRGKHHYCTHSSFSSNFPSTSIFLICFSSPLMYAFTKTCLDGCSSQGLLIGVQTGTPLKRRIA